MYDRFGAGSGSSFNDKEYEVSLREGITAAKGGRRGLARRLLLAATAQRGNDPRPWIWLSVTTDDPEEQREYLERAVGIDPMNEAARRGLIQLRARLGEIPEVRMIGADEPEAPPEDATVQVHGASFTCPHCGATTRYDQGVREVICDHCGQAVSTPEAAGEGPDQSFHMALLHDQAFAWAASQQEVACSQCGAHTLLPPEQKTSQCPYCGSNQLVAHIERSELEDPERIGLFEVQEQKAHALVLKWLEQGALTPDNIKKEVRKMHLRPAYYPFWIFNGLVQAPWSAEVESPMRRDQWEHRSGSLQEFFDDVIVPGVKALTWRETQRLEPFALDRLVKFEPGHVAGWLALTYDRTLADASLDARERVITRLRRQATSRIEPGQNKRNVQVGVGSWADVNYQLVLLPLWVGSYHFKKETFYLLVNGQTGEVQGKKPRDLVKLWLFLFIALGGILAVSLLVWAISSL